MDIDAFILANRPGWQRLEEACKSGRSGLSRLDGPSIDEVVAGYLKVSADLSQVQTRYKDAQLAAYLSSVLAAASSAIYSARPRTTRGAVRLFGSRYRESVRETTRFTVIAAAVMFGTMLAAYLWISLSPSAQNGFFPPEARAAMRMAGGDDGGDTFGLSPGGVAALIFANNVRVALLAFVLGITFGAGTIWMLVQNGFIVGSLAAGFASAGQLGVFTALIVPHGLLELTAICIAGGAGMRIGWALVVPGDRSRTAALQHEAAQAVITSIGVIPAFLVAALIEGLITGRDLAVPLQIGIGILAEVAYLVFIFGAPGGRKRKLQPAPGFDPEVLVGQPAG